MALVAAGVAGLTIVFSLCAWMMLGGQPAYINTRAQVLDPPRIPVFSSRWTTENSARTPATTASAPSAFDIRFASRSPAPPTRSLQPPSTQPPATQASSTSSFSTRFAAGSTPPVLPSQFVLASVPTDIVTVPAPAPHAAARALIARVAPPRRAAAPVRVASLGDTPIRTAYAPNPDANIDASLPREMTAPKDAATNPDMSHTAVYDLTAHVVYLPNGRRLEAHSGLGEHMDDLAAINLRNLGPTPPGIYELTMRERRFHGIDAIRLNPVDDGKMYGRDGILAHPYMLGANGQSNGCVSFKEYDEFLAAFRRGEFNRLVVVERLDGDPPGGGSATSWFADKLKGFRGLFGQS